MRSLSLLLHKKVVGNKQIKDITSYVSSFSSLKNLLVVNGCKLVEIAIVPLPILASAYCFRFTQTAPHPKLQ